jgi:hypothetical protein
MGRGSGTRLQPTVLQAVIEHIAARETTSSINRTTRVARNTVSKIRLSLEYWGVPYPPRCVRLGRPATLRQAYLDGLKQYLDGRPQAYIEEMRD